jgi:hypothetical protein
MYICRKDNKQQDANVLAMYVCWRLSNFVEAQHTRTQGIRNSHLGFLCHKGTPKSVIGSQLTKMHFPYLGNTCVQPTLQTPTELSLPLHIVHILVRRIYTCCIICLPPSLPALPFYYLPTYYLFARVSSDLDLTFSSLTCFTTPFHDSNKQRIEQ